MHQYCMYLILFSNFIQIQLMLQNKTMLCCISCKTNAITPINSFWSSDNIWWQKSASTLAQVMLVAWWHQTTTWTNDDWSSVMLQMLQYPLQVLSKLLRRLVPCFCISPISQGARTVPSLVPTEVVLQWEHPLAWWQMYKRIVISTVGFT